MLNEIKESARKAALELCEKACLKAGQSVVVGCSTSEILGHHIGTESSADIGKAVFDALSSVFDEIGVFLVAQCCEHLNRTLVIGREAAGPLAVVVNAIPTPAAGGAFAAAAYARIYDPVCIERFSADAGLDIGGTLIGMHLKRVAVPLRLENNTIGKAHVIAARTRPPYIGGSRTIYDESLG